jgi:hypothetical protein
MGNSCNILVGKPEGNRPFGITRCRWEKNIRIDFTETVWEGVTGCMSLDTDQWPALVNTVMNLLLP